MKLEERTPESEHRPEAPKCAPNAEQMNMREISNRVENKPSCEHYRNKHTKKSLIFMYPSKPHPPAIDYQLLEALTGCAATASYHA